MPHATLAPHFPLLERTVVRRYAVAAVVTFVAITGVIAAVDFAVDPFQHYRRPTWYEPRFYRTLQRHIDPGMARHYDYDTVITGSSMMENYSNAEAGRILGGKAIDLAMGAATAYELARLLDTIIATGKAKHVVLDLNFNAFAGPPTMQVVTEPLPLYLYDDVRWNDARYLLQAQTLQRSLEILFDADDHRHARPADHPWAWAGEYEFSKRAVLRGLDLAAINRQFRQAPRTLEGMRASFEANLLPIFRAHPEVRFSLVYPPYSALVWKDFRQRGQVDVSLAFKRYVFDAVAPLANVMLYDFQPRRDWVTNLDNYKDIYHFNPAISRAMLESIAAGTDRVSRESMLASEEFLRALAESPDFEPPALRP